MSWQLGPYDLFPPSKAKDSKSPAAQRGVTYHNRVYRIVEADLALTELEVYREPWYYNPEGRKWCQPDMVVVNTRLETAAVIEVKMNWKIGRDHKVLGVYKDATKEAFSLKFARPVMIVSNLYSRPGKAFFNRKEFYARMFEENNDPMPPTLLLP